MSSRERPADRGSRLGRALLVRLGSEIRLARVDRGLSLDVMAAAVGLSSVELSRIERGLAPKVPFINIARVAGAAGLDLVAKLYLGSSVVRDHAHVELLRDLHSLLHPSLRWDLEVPLPAAGDQRAWDGLVRGSDWRFGVEAETSPRDAQALLRRIDLKQRDGEVDGVLLAVRDTATVRHFLREAGDLLRVAFPIQGRNALAALRAGTRPPGNAIVVVPRRSR